MKLIITLVAAVTIATGCTSCGVIADGQELRGPITGIIYTNEGVRADESTISNLFAKLQRLAKGDTVQDIVVNPNSTK